MDRTEIDLLLSTAERWYRANAPLESRVATFRQGQHEPPGAWQQMADMGWLGLTLPEALGGFGASHEAAFELLRIAGRDARPEPLELHLLLAPLVAGAMAQHAQALMDGSMRLGLADLVDGAGSGAAHFSSDSTITGVVGNVLGALHATHWLLPVSAHGEVLLALVDAKAAGITGTAARFVDSRYTIRLEFQSTKATRIEGDGFWMQALDRAAASLVADSAGALEAAFALTLDYLKQRIQFGKPLSSQQAVQHKMAEVFCDLQQLLALSRRLAAEFDTHPRGPWPTLAAAKSFVGRRALRACGQLIQISGGVAVTEEYKLTHFYRRLHVAAQLFGSAEVQLDRIDARSQLLAA